MRRRYVDTLEELDREVLTMGTLVEESLQKALLSFEERNTDTAREIIDGEHKIKRLQLKIEEKCTLLIAMEQPVASDLRRLISDIEIVSHLDLITNHAVHLARTTLGLSDKGYIAPIAVLVPSLAKIGINMVRDAMTAYINRDEVLARKTAEYDDVLDEMHKKIFDNCIKYMKENPDRIKQTAEMLFLIRFLDRLGDHVITMCEWIIYCTTGKHEKLKKKAEVNNGA